MTKSSDSEFERLKSIMQQLRNPDGGCPWDLEQTFETIAPYTIEEAYEVADAIESGDRAALCDELGDLLLQVVFHARIAEEEGSFTLADVARSVSNKMINRHPHVFGDDSKPDMAWQRQQWEEIKQAERAAKGQNKHQKHKVGIAHVKGGARHYITFYANLRGDRGGLLISAARGKFVLTA